MERKIRIVSTITGCGVLLIPVNIIYTVFSWLIPLCFTDPNRWGDWVEDASLVNATTFDRWTLFLNWSVYLLAVVFVMSIAMRICIQYRKGEYFSVKTYQLIFHLGVGIVGSITLFYIVRNIQALIIASTIDGDHFFDYAFLRIDSTLLTVLVCGVFFCIIGWVMKIASEMKAENEAII